MPEISNSFNLPKLVLSESILLALIKRGCLYPEMTRGFIVYPKVSAAETAQNSLACTVLKLHARKVFT